MIDSAEIKTEVNFSDSSLKANPTAHKLLEWAISKYSGRLAIVTSFQASGLIIIDIASRISKKIRVVTIDTGRLHEETYSFIDEVRNHYGIDVEVLFPDGQDVRQLVSAQGMNLFYQDVEARQACCRVRKVHPLTKFLSGVDAWVTGLRRDQASSRSSVEKFEIDHEHGSIYKLNPLAEWTEAEIQNYTARFSVPQHPLYEKGFTSIGCEPCTRPIESGEDARAGRWWWESTGRKECGLHCRV